MRKFLDLNFDVACLDVALPSTEIAARTEVEIGEISNASVVLRVFSKVKPNVVIHLASIGMGGSAMLHDACYLVNVVGTRNIVHACIAEAVEALVYVST